MRYLTCVIFLFFFSCEKKNRIEKEKNGKYIIEKTIRNDSIISSKTYNGKQLIWEFVYKNGIIFKAIEYFPDNKIKSTSSLIKLPNHYYDISYYNNGVMESEGESDYIKNKGYRLRRGGTLFYNKSGKAYQIKVFVNDGNQEYLTRYTIFDTIKNKTIKDVTYDPPILSEKESPQNGKIFNSK